MAINYEAWLAADEVRMCVCVMIMNGFFYNLYISVLLLYTEKTIL